MMRRRWAWTAVVLAVAAAAVGLWLRLSRGGERWSPEAPAPAEMPRVPAGADALQEPDEVPLEREPVHEPEPEPPAEEAEDEPEVPTRNSEWSRLACASLNLPEGAGLGYSLADLGSLGVFGEIQVVAAGAPDENGGAGAVHVLKIARDGTCELAASITPAGLGFPRTRRFGSSLASAHSPSGETWLVVSGRDGERGRTILDIFRLDPASPPGKHVRLRDAEGSEAFLERRWCTPKGEVSLALLAPEWPTGERLRVLAGLPDPDCHGNGHVGLIRAQDDGSAEVAFLEIHAAAGRAISGFGLGLACVADAGGAATLAIAWYEAEEDAVFFARNGGWAFEPQLGLFALGAGRLEPLTLLPLPPELPATAFRTLSNVGDVDGDGLEELALGSGPWGRQVVLFDSTAASVSELERLRPGHDAWPEEVKGDDHFGASFTRFSGPGLGGAFLIGAPGDDTYGQDAGALWLVTGWEHGAD